MPRKDLNFFKYSGSHLYLGCPVKLVSFRYNRNRNRKKFRNYPKQKDLFRFFRKIPELERFGSFSCLGSTKKEPKEPKGGKREGEGGKGNGREMEGKGKGKRRVRVGEESKIQIQTRFN